MKAYDRDEGRYVTLHTYYVHFPLDAYPIPVQRANLDEVREWAREFNGDLRGVRIERVDD